MCLHDVYIYYMYTTCHYVSMFRSSSHSKKTLGFLSQWHTRGSQDHAPSPRRKWQESLTPKWVKLWSFEHMMTYEPTVLVCFTKCGWFLAQMLGTNLYMEHLGLRKTVKEPILRQTFDLCLAITFLVNVGRSIKYCIKNWWIHIPLVLTKANIQFPFG